MCYFLAALAKSLFHDINWHCLFARFSDVNPNEQVPDLFYDSDFDTPAELPSLDSFISKDIIRKLKREEKKWQEVVNGKHYVLVLVQCINILVVAAITGTKIAAKQRCIDNSVVRTLFNQIQSHNKRISRFYTVCCCC